MRPNKLSTRSILGHVVAHCYCAELLELCAHVLVMAHLPGHEDEANWATASFRDRDDLARQSYS